MKSSLALIAVLAAALSGPAAASIETTSARPAASEPAAVIAMRAVVNGCLPRVMGQDPRTSGFRPADDVLRDSLLAGREGTVLSKSDDRIFMIEFDAEPMCRIMALSVPVADVAELTRQIFADAAMPFTETRYSLMKDGAFTARYVSPPAATGVTVMVAASPLPDGSSFAAITVVRRSTIDGSP